VLLWVEGSTVATRGPLAVVLGRNAVRLAPQLMGSWFRTERVARWAPGHLGQDFTPPDRRRLRWVALLLRSPRHQPKGKSPVRTPGLTSAEL